MTTFVGTEARLVAALRTGVVPEAIRRKPVAFARREDDLIALVPSAADAKEIVEAMAAAGFDIEDGDDDVQEVGSWAETIAPKQVGEAEPPLGEIMFVGRGLDVCATLIELGCDQQELLFAGGRAFVRTVDPPYYPVLRAAEPESNLFALRPADEERRVWIELGFDHPLAPTLGDPKSLLIMPSTGPWWRLPDGPWTDVYDRIELTSFDREPQPHDEDTQRISVSLRLERTNRFAQETMWILREGGEAIVDRLVRTLPDSVVEQLAFARFGSTWAIRARRLGDAPPQIDVGGEAYAPAPNVPDLLVPVGHTIAPPLRPARLRELLAPDPDRLVWVAPGYTFRVESCADAAFQPLSDWIEYVVEENAGVLEHWMSKATFTFEAYRSIGGEWADGPKKPEKAERKKKDVEEVETEEVAAPMLPKTPARRRRRAKALPQIETTGNEARARLDEIETAFRSHEGAATERVGMWVEMAPLQSALGRDKEAALCWAQAIWEHDEPADLARRWHESVGAPTRFKDHTPTWAAAATIVRAHLTGDIEIDPTEAQGWFVPRADSLDARSFWLANRALAALAGEDRLALVRARDTIVHRLRRGMSAREVPAFVRSGGSGEALLADHLGRLEAYYGKTKRNRSALEAPAALTDAYVSVVLAWGHARLGQRAAAIEAMKSAAELAAGGDDAHRFMAGAYCERVRQALDGDPPGAPLPTRLTMGIDLLARMDRYRIDRIRQASWIIEPARLDPIDRFLEASAAHRAASDDPLERAQALLVEARETKDPKVAADNLGGVLELADVIREPASSELVQQVVDDCERAPPSERAAFLTDALIFACFAERGPLIEQTLDGLEAALGALSGDALDGAAELFASCAPMLIHGGAAEEATALLDAVSSRVNDDDVIARLAIASAAAAFGTSHDLPTAIEAANGELSTVIANPRKLAQALDLARAICRALAHTSAEQAAGGVGALTVHLKNVTDSFTTTNSHLCLSVVHFMESMVLALSSGNLALSKWARRFVEEDEHRIRWRIHRDLSVNP